MEASWEVYAFKLKNKKLFEADDFFQEHIREFQERFLVHFDEMCKEIIKKQESGELSAIAYLDYTLLYFHFLQRNYVAEVRVYGEDWYRDPDQKAIGTFDVSMLFGKLTELWEELLTARKAYAGKIESRRVDEFMVEAMPSFFAYVGSGIRFAILTAVKGENFKQIRRRDEFEINAGQYLGNMEPMYKENRNKDREVFLEWFGKRLKYAYMFEDLSGMDYSGEDLSEIDFRYSDLRNTVLRRTDLQDSMLFGTRFCHADMEGADLRYCMIFEADFTGANLKGAKFSRTLGNAGLPGRKTWKIVGYQGVNFQDADLRGADFTKAKLYGANFAGAKMEGTVFDKESIASLNLNEEQKKEIAER